MSNLVIVAIPAEDDYINKISSEKVPHMTLLFLGEDATKVKNLDKIIDFTKHSANTILTRFGLEVDRRGELGPDKADVIFFSTSKWSGIETIKQFRSFLLKEPNIRIAYDSTEQFPEWIPHLTLGSPDTPAKPDERDYPGINYVNFDRIAVWFGEYEGIEIPLKRYEYDMEVAMNDPVAVHTRLLGKKMLSHISEKPWGEISESDYTLEQWHNACLIHLHKGSPTSKSQCKLPVRTPSGALNRNGVHAAAAALAGARSPLKAPPKQKAKAASALRRYYGELDETPPDSLKQSAIIENILTHFGVKGMKWGVRRERSSAVTVSDRRKKIKTSGGRGLPAHPDALRAHRIGQVAKKSGLKAVSNQDLSIYANRLQLEQNVARLTSTQKSRSTKFVANVLSRSGNSLASEAVNRGAKEAGKKALKLARSR